MRILAIAQVENAQNLIKQIQKQTVKPDDAYIFVDPQPATEIDGRRQRIAENHEHLMEVVDGVKPELVWQLEGDGEYPEDCLERLLKRYEELKAADFGYISGVQVGRHGIYCLGAWLFNQDRTEFSSLDYHLGGVKEVDATGFYCLLAERETWLNGICSWNGERWGPDVNWGLSLKNLGYRIYADTDIEVGHITKRGVIQKRQPSTCNVKFYKTGGSWRYKITE